MEALVPSVVAQEEQKQGGDAALVEATPRSHEEPVAALTTKEVAASYQCDPSGRPIDHRVAAFLKVLLSSLPLGAADEDGLLRLGRHLRGCKLTSKEVLLLRDVCFPTALDVRCSLLARLLALGALTSAQLYGDPQQQPSLTAVWTATLRSVAKASAADELVSGAGLYESLVCLWSLQPASSLAETASLLASVEALSALPPEVFNNATTATAFREIGDELRAQLAERRKALCGEGLGENAQQEPAAAPVASSLEQEALSPGDQSSLQQRSSPEPQPAGTAAPESGAAEPPLPAESVPTEPSPAAPPVRGETQLRSLFAGAHAFHPASSAPLASAAAESSESAASAPSEPPCAPGRGCGPQASSQLPTPPAVSPPPPAASQPLPQPWSALPGASMSSKLVGAEQPASASAGQQLPDPPLPPWTPQQAASPQVGPRPQAHPPGFPGTAPHALTWPPPQQQQPQPSPALLAPPPENELLGYLVPALQSHQPPQQQPQQSWLGPPPAGAVSAGSSWPSAAPQQPPLWEQASAASSLPPASQPQGAWQGSVLPPPSLPPRRMPTYNPMQKGGAFASAPLPTSVLPPAAPTSHAARPGGFAAPASSGLSNMAGEYNCFLNSLVQSLFAVRCFRDYLKMSSPGSAPSGAPANRVEACRGLVQALKTLMDALQGGVSLRRDEEAVARGGGSAITPLALRQALVRLRGFTGEGGRMNEMADAGEVLGHMYEAFITLSTANDVRQGGSGNPEETRISKMFSIIVRERVFCTHCRLESHKLEYPQFFQQTHAVALRDAPLAQDLSSSAFERRLVTLLASYEKSCDRDPPVNGCGRPKLIYHS